MSHIPAFDFDQSTTPSFSRIGQTWRERDSNKLVVEQWFWDGTNLLSINTTPRDTLLISGQSITLTNIIVGLVAANTDEIPFSINSNYGIYVSKLYVAARVPTGNLSATNYWQLLLKNGATTLQTLDIKASDDGVTTGDIRKTSLAINVAYPKTGKYTLSLIQQGLPPGLRSPSALIEYRLVR